MIALEEEKAIVIDSTVLYSASNDRAFNHQAASTHTTLYDTIYKIMKMRVKE
jgi:hypothetical protein